MKPGAKEIEKYKLGLIEKQYWLDSTYQQSALDRLFKECSDKEEADLLRKLLLKFKCSDPTDFYTFYESEAERITNDQTITRDNSIVGPTTDDELPDSSQDVIRPFSFFLRKKRNILNVRNHFEHIKRFIESTNQAIINIILLDDFIGSGKTIVTRINRCNGLIQANSNIQYCSFHIISLVVMDKGKMYIEGNGATVSAKFILKRGISDNFIGTALTQAKDKMLRLESLLFNNPGNHEYSFGFKKSEALYAKVLYESTHPITGEKDFVLDRTPNNVFPIFWWSKYENGTTRKPLLYR